MTDPVGLNDKYRISPKLRESLDRLLVVLEEGQKYTHEFRYVCSPCRDTGWVELDDDENGYRFAKRCEAGHHLTRTTDDPPKSAVFK